MFSEAKIENFIGQKRIFFFYFCSNIGCGYTLKPPRGGGSNEYSQSMFWIKNKKKYIYPCKPQFLYESGVLGGINLTDMFS